MATRGPYSSRFWEPIDQWLESQGFYRKHIARDGSCLFRAVAEQVYHTQVLHSQVRTQCVNFMQQHEKLFQEFVKESFEDHVSAMQKPWEWGGELEMKAMSYLYRRDFLVYREVGAPPVDVTLNDFEEKIYLCSLQNNQYDSVYPKDYIKDSGFCQSIVYHMLYDDVFKMEDIDIAVDKMLHDKTIRMKRETRFAHFNDCTLRKQYLGGANGIIGKYTFKIEDLPLDNKVSDEWYNNAKEILFQGIIPFPYKVAKALDPEIYRNIEFDVWNEMRKGLRWVMGDGLYGDESGELRVGSKCIVKLETSPDKELHAHIQEMSHDKGPVLVYIEELAEKCTVKFEELEPLQKSTKKPQPTEARKMTSRDSRTCYPPVVCIQNSQTWESPQPAKTTKFNVHGPKDMLNDISNVQNDGKVPNVSVKEPRGRRNSGCRGRGRPILPTSNLSISAQSVPRGNCPNSTVKQEQRLVGDKYPHLMFSNHQLQVNLAHPPNSVENPVNLANQVNSILEANATVPSNPEKHPSPLATCTSTSACASEGVSSSTNSSGTVCASLQCEMWEGNHHSMTLQRGETEEPTWGPPAMCCCCAAFPLLEWRPGNPTSFPSCILPACAANVSTIPPGSLPRPLPPGVSLNAPESVMPDGRDLPYSDIPTLRFFYNLGHDYLRSGYFTWSNILPNSEGPRKEFGNEVEGLEGEGQPTLNPTQHEQEHQQDHHQGAIIPCIPHDSQVVPSIQPVIPYARQMMQQSQDFTPHLGEEEKHVYSASTIHSGYTNGQSQSSSNTSVTIENVGGGSRRRGDLRSSGSGNRHSHRDMEPPSGGGRWLNLTHHSPPAMTPPYGPPGFSPSILPFPSQSSIEGHFCMYSTASGPSVPGQGHHFMYGPFEQPPHMMHHSSPPPFPAPMPPRFVYPNMNGPFPPFPISHQ